MKSDVGVCTTEDGIGGSGAAVRSLVETRCPRSLGPTGAPLVAQEIALMIRVPSPRLVRPCACEAPTRQEAGVREV